MLRLIIACFAAVLPVAAADAQTTTPDLRLLDRQLRQIVEDQGVVGASVAISDTDGLIYAQGFGSTDREAGLSAGPDTPFRAGSVSKLITAMIALRLVEAGALDLQTPLSQAAPDIAFTNRWEGEAPVRLVHLLELTAGWDDIQLQEYRSFSEGTTLAQGLADNPPSRTARWAPGLYHSYANSGPAGLGAVIERVTGQDFDAVARELLFAPLGLETASFNQDSPERRIASYTAQGERSGFTRIWAGPSGSLSISAADLAAVGRLLLNEGDGLLAPETVRRMERGETSRAAEAELAPYGLGLYPSRDATGLWYGHAGAVDAAQAELFYNRETGLTYALLVNTSGPAMGELRDALRAALGGDASAPTAQDGWILPDGAAGVYRIVNPRQEMVRALIDLFEPVRVSACDDALCVARGLGAAPDAYTPMGGGLFFKADAPHERLALISGPGGLFEISLDDGETFRKSGALRLYAPVALWIATLIAVAAALITLLVWSAARPFGVFKDQNRWRVWLWPSLSIASLVLGLGAFMALSAGDVLANFAGPSPGGRLIQLGTLAFGPLAAVGLWTAFRAQAVRLFARLQAGATSALLALCWLWMAAYGWAGLTPWSYAPNVFG
jgi:CubicO group peptidase (beta-lactamase class C family)